MSCNLLDLAQQEALTPPGGVVVWGDIGGLLPDQTDLQDELDLKAPLDAPNFTGNVGVGTRNDFKLHVNQSGYIASIADAQSKAGFFGYYTGTKNQGVLAGVSSNGSGFIQGMDGSSAYRMQLQPFDAEVTIGAVTGMPNASKLEVNGSTYIKNVLKLGSYNNASPQDNDIWIDSGVVYVRISGVTKTFNLT